MVAVAHIRDSSQRMADVSLHLHQMASVMKNKLR